MNSTWKRFRSVFCAALTMPVLTSCRGAQSALDPGGIQAQNLAGLWWTFFFVCAAVYLIVMSVLLIALFKAKKGDAGTEPETAPDPGREKRLGTIVKGAVGITLIVLFVLMITSFRTGHAIDTLSRVEGPLTIKITGHQWWWEVEYTDESSPSNNVLTANEIHIPVGRPIKLELHSNDVIHSFWLPNMHGKKDLIPNYPTNFFFQADKPGIYWGQCAEFCGYQHAKMRFIVTAETPEEFDSWLGAQRQTPPAPSTDPQKRGQDIFLVSVCTQCHAVQGTIANARVGPNLTHIASRPYLAAGTLQNTEDHMQKWLTDPQAIKPGVQMPMTNYSPADVQAMVEYLKSLK